MPWKTSVDGPYLIGGLLSMAASLLLLGTFLTQRTLQRRSLMRLVAFMAACDFFFALSFFLPSLVASLSSSPRGGGGSGGPGNDALCDGQALFAQFFGMATISWHLCITLNATSALTKQNVSVLALRERESRYHAFVWGMAASTSVAAASAGSLGRLPDGACWITGQRSFVRLVFYLPLFVYMLAALALLARVAARRHYLRTANSKNRALTRMLLYVLAFVAVWAVPVGVRLSELVTGAVPPPGVVALERTCVSLNGVANFVVWSSSPAFAGARARAAAALCCLFGGGAAARRRRQRVRSTALDDGVMSDSEADGGGGDGREASYSYASDTWNSPGDAEGGLFGGGGGSGGGGGAGYTAPAYAGYSAPLPEPDVPHESDQSLVDALFSSPQVEGPPGRGGAGVERPHDVL